MTLTKLQRNSLLFLNKDTSNGSVINTSHLRRERLLVEVICKIITLTHMYMPSNTKLRYCQTRKVSSSCASGRSGGADEAPGMSTSQESREASKIKNQMAGSRECGWSELPDHNNMHRKAVA